MERMRLDEKESLLDRRTNSLLLGTLVLFPISIALLVAFALFVLSGTKMLSTY